MPAGNIIMKQRTYEAELKTLITLVYLYQLNSFRDTNISTTLCSNHCTSDLFISIDPFLLSQDHISYKYLNIKPFEASEGGIFNLKRFSLTVKADAVMRGIF